MEIERGNSILEGPINPHARMIKAAARNAHFDPTTDEARDAKLWKGSRPIRLRLIIRPSLIHEVR